MACHLAGIETAIATCGTLVVACAWFAPPSRHLWQALTLAGAIGFRNVGLLVEPLALRGARGTAHRLLRIERRLAGDFIEQFAHFSFRHPVII